MFFNLLQNVKEAGLKLLIWCYSKNPHNVMQLIKKRPT